jgi:hypothetical protein
MLNAYKSIMRNEGVTMKIAKIITMAPLLCALVGTLALAKTKFHTINFDQDTMVNGTLVKKGEYQAKFDEQTNELSLLKDGHVIVTTTAKEEVLAKKAPETSFDIRTGDNSVVLTKVTFGGERYSLLLGDSQAAEGR